jgi:UDP-N-acetylglucosamine 3-dehydrogenase
MTGHIYRFNNAVNRVKQLLQENYFGETYLTKFTWTNQEPLYRDRDIISDLAPHPFDIMEYLFGGRIDEVSCVGNSYRQRDLVEAAFINCRSGRILVNMELSWLTPWKQRSLDLVGSDRSVRVDCLSQKIDVYHDGKVESMPVEQNNTIRDELKNFLECITNGKRSTADGESAVMAIRMVEMTRKSLREKRTLRL